MIKKENWYIWINIKNRKSKMNLRIEIYLLQFWKQSQIVQLEANPQKARVK